MALEAFLLGRVRFRFNGRDLPKLPTRKSENLLALLVLAGGRWLERDQIAETLWPEYPPADPLKAVRHELWIVRSALRQLIPDADDVLAASGNAVRLQTSPTMQCDVRDFERSLTRAGDDFDASRIAELEAAIGLYAGDFMPGHVLRWSVWRRRALRDTYLCALETLGRIHEANGDWERAIDVLKTLTAADPLIESAHRALMRCYAATGDRVRALRQYQACREYLAEAFEGTVSPMADTEALRAAIVDGSALATDRHARAFPWPAAHKSIDGMALKPNFRRLSQSLESDAAAHLGAVREDIRAICGQLDRLVANLNKI